MLRRIVSAAIDRQLIARLARLQPGDELRKVKAELEHERTEGRRRFLEERFVYVADAPLAQKRMETLFSLLTPHVAKGVGKVRLGRPNDGGYVSLDDFALTAVFSLGINDDVSWDEDAVKRGVFPIHQYDHTVDGPPVRHDRFKFNKKSIGLGADAVSLTRMLRDAGISAPASALLKIDIEHAEWPVFAATPDEDLACFSQIIGEFHGFDEVLSDRWYEEALETFTRISKHFRLVHVHGNNYASQVVVGSKLVPRCMEMTFANIGRYDLSPSGETFPTALDQPNCLTKPELWLDGFRF